MPSQVATAAAPTSRSRPTYSSRPSSPSHRGRSRGVRRGFCGSDMVSNFQLHSSEPGARNPRLVGPAGPPLVGPDPSFPQLSTRVPTGGTRIPPILAVLPTAAEGALRLVPPFSSGTAPQMTFGAGIPFGPGVFDPSSRTLRVLSFNGQEFAEAPWASPGFVGEVTVPKGSDHLHLGGLGGPVPPPRKPKKTDNPAPDGKVPSGMNKKTFESTIEYLGAFYCSFGIVCDFTLADKVIDGGKGVDIKDALEVGYQSAEERKKDGQEGGEHVGAGLDGGKLTAALRERMKGKDTDWDDIEDITFIHDPKAAKSTDTPIETEGRDAAKKSAADHEDKPIVIHQRVVFQDRRDAIKARKKK